MRTIGLLGGMSWESSIEYERIINESVRDVLGGTHSADLVIRSFDFAEIEHLQEIEDWDGASALLAESARALERSGAEVIVLCTNTMHQVAEAISAAVQVPFLHIAEPTADAIIESGIKTVALLGTRYTMEQQFISRPLQHRGIEVLVPPETDRNLIHDIIFDELVRGIITESSRERVVATIARLTESGADGVVAGCTEIELLVRPCDIEVPLFPTARLHAEAAARWALEN